MYQIKYITYPEQVQFELQLQLWAEEEVQALIGEVAVVELLVAAVVEAAEELQRLE